MTPITLSEVRANLRANLSPGWLRPGLFSGSMPRVRWLGPRAYMYEPQVDPTLRFAFVAPDGVRIEPGVMHTDAGSVPRVAWSIPDLDPWAYLPAYLIHDWLFETHHGGLDLLGFEASNVTLAHAIWTLIESGVAGGGWLDVEVIYHGVASDFGRYVWDHGSSVV